MVIGHSLGEYSALCVAGVLSVSDTLFLIGRRAQLMEENLTSGQYAMLAIGSDLKSVRQLLAVSESAWAKTGIACINAPQITVVSGPVDEVNHLKSRLVAGGSRATLLRVPYGFHSHHVDPILEHFQRIAKGATMSVPTIPIASTLLGEIVEKGQRDVFSASYLARQARECVNFTGALEALQSHARANVQTSWLEIGPDAVCLGLVRRSLDIPLSRLLPTMKAADDNWVTTSSALAALYQAGASINWPQYYKEFKSSVSLLPLPTYAFDEKEFWIPFAERVNTTLLTSQNSKKVQESSTPPAATAFSTTSLQWIEEEKIEGKAMSVTFGSHTSQSSLYEVISGHVVNGLTICSLSIFCDMAKSAAQYVYQKLTKSPKFPIMNIYNVDMTHALVVPKADPQLIVKTAVSYSSTGNVADITFSSTDGAAVTEHGTCKVVFENSTEWFAQLSHTSFLVDTRIQALKDMSVIGKAHRLMKPLVYRLFDDLVAYSKDFQGLEEVWVDPDCRDAVGTVKLPSTTGAGNFLYNPFWIDCTVHLAGFLVNSSLKYPVEIACLSTGFESWRSLEELQADEVYTTYVSMQEKEASNMLSGAAYVYNSRQKLVQVTTGIRFQKMKKLVLNSILRPATTHTDKAVAWRNDVAPVQKTTRPPKLSAPTPAIQSSGSSEDERGEQSTGTNTPASSVGDDRSVSLLDTLLSVVASESGCNISDMESDTTFADLGMDSLMAITIIATFQKDTGVELPATFFLEHTTVAEGKEALAHIPQAESTGKPFEESRNRLEAFPTFSATSEVPTVTQSYEPGSILVGEQAPSPASLVSPSAGPTESVKPSKAILLHGSPSSTGPKLFLFPDGSGSPSRYIQLPALGDNINVYGLESPYLKAPTNYTCSVKAMCDSFLAALKDGKPTSPYLLGGFSLGAIYAYEISCMLLKDQEHVDGLFIIDVAVPDSYGDTLVTTQEEILEAGLLPPSGRWTTAQKEHFARTIGAMTAYSPTSCSPDERPKKTVLISSKTPLGSGKHSKLARWANGNESVSRGWEELVGPVELRQVDADHFSMFKHPAVSYIWSFALLKLDANTIWQIKTLRDIWAEQLWGIV